MRKKYANLLFFLKYASWTHNLILTLTLTLKVKLIFASGEDVFE